MRNSTRRGLQRGFTLVELLVALIIVAVLSAFVVPDVINRVDDGDPSRVAADMVDIGTAIELFKVDMKTVMPSDLEDLIRTPQTDSTDQPITLVKYTSNARWDGPYMKKVISDSATIGTGFGGAILDELYLVAVATGTSGQKGVNTLARNPTNCTNANYVSVAITGIDSVDFEALNDVIDGEGTLRETDGHAHTAYSSGSMVHGNLRWKSDGASTTTDTTFYLVTACR